MIRIDYLRQSGIYDPLKNSQPVTLIGCGGIGSFAAVALAKLGIKKMTLYDDDKIEFHNLPNQMFKVNGSNGKRKVYEVADLCTDFSDDVTVEPHADKFKDQQVSGIVISGVDSMESRKVIWEKIKFNPAVGLYIDARIGGQGIRVLTVNPLNKKAVKDYEKSLHTDDEAEDLACTDRNIIDVGFAVASIIVRLVRGFLTKEKIPSVVLLSMKELTLTTVGG